MDIRLVVYSELRIFTRVTDRVWVQWNKLLPSRICSCVYVWMSVNYKVNAPFILRSVYLSCFFFFCCSMCVYVWFHFHILTRRVQLLLANGTNFLSLLLLLLGFFFFVLVVCLEIKVFRWYYRIERETRMELNYRRKKSWNLIGFSLFSGAV